MQQEVPTVFSHLHRYHCGQNTRQWCPCPGANGCVWGGNYHGEKMSFSLLRVVVYSMVFYSYSMYSTVLLQPNVSHGHDKFHANENLNVTLPRFVGGETVPLSLITSLSLRSSHDCRLRHYRYVPCHGCVEVYVALFLGGVVSRLQIGGRAPSLPPRSLLRAPCSLHCLTAWHSQKFAMPFSSCDPSLSSK